MHKSAIFALAAALIVLFGCVSQLPAQLPPAPSPPALVGDDSALGRNSSPTLVGGDRDSHGCIGSAGYSWCEHTQKCYRPWEENCTAQLDGSDRDAHGCIGSAGYSWCEHTQKCYRPWEENCTAPVARQCTTVADCGEGAARCVNGTCTQYDEHGCVPDGGYVWCEVIRQCIQPWITECNASKLTNSPLLGSDRDGHGCIASAGYSWCEEKGKCLRVWEEACNATDRLANALEHCADENVAQVSVCGQHVKVVSSLMGGGSTFYDDSGTATICPLVSPDAMSEECRLLMLGDNCVELEVDCGKANVPGAVTDLKDDPSFVGAQLSWSAPDANAVDYEIFRASQDMSSVSLIKTTGQASYDDVFDGKGATFAYFIRARNAAGAESPVSNIIYVQQLSTSATPSPGQID